MNAAMPVVDVDPFSPEFLADPYPAHERMRESGPVFWLPRYEIAGIARFAEVRKVLLDWETFSSARGVGLADLARQTGFRLPSPALETDPPKHTRGRTVLNKALSPAVVKSLRERFTKVAEEMADDLVDRGECCAVADIAEAYPLRVFPDAIGMKPDGRHNLLPYGDMVFNSFGPANELFEAAAPRAAAVFPWVQTQSLRENLSADGFGALVYEAVDAGEITEEEGAALVRGILTAGVDTTVNGIGAALYCLARYPEQWTKLRANPQLARAAFEEAIRFESPVQTFFRTTVRPTELAGVSLPEGQKILMLLGSANRDPRKWSRPDEYDIERTVAGHVGFGAGIHVCVGQFLAKLEGEVILTALAARVTRLEITAPPERRFNNTLRGLKHLPLRLHP